MRTLRSLAGLTQASLAELAQVACSTIEDWERKKNPDCSTKTLQKVAKGLHESRKLPYTCDELYTQLLLICDDPMYLRKCLVDSLEWEERMKPEVIHIDALAIDLVDGRRNIQQTIEKTTAHTIRYRVLMLCTSNDCRFQDEADFIRQQVRSWGAHADIELANLLQNPIDRNGKDITLSIRRYTETPTTHGICIATFDSTLGLTCGQHFITACGVEGEKNPQYDWGDGHYKKIEFEASKPEMQPDGRGFHLQFETLWKQAKKTEIKSLKLPSGLLSLESQHVAVVEFR